MTEQPKLPFDGESLRRLSEDIDQSASALGHVLVKANIALAQSIVPFAGVCRAVVEDYNERMAEINAFTL